MRTQAVCLLAGLMMAGNIVAQSKPSGPKQAGDFRKVTLESEHKQNEKFIENTGNP
ncbi:MAG: hypothetical protein ACJZ8W_01830 [Limisphaerales bacterium]